MPIALMILLFAQVHPPNLSKELAKHTYLLSEATRIPRTCAHPHLMKGRTTCRIYVRFPEYRVQAEPRHFFAWDNSDNPDDTTYRVGILHPGPHGMYIEGVKGHLISWEVDQ